MHDLKIRVFDRQPQPIAARSKLDTDDDVVTTKLLLLHAWSSKVLKRASIRNYKGAGLYWTGAATLTEVPPNALII